EDPSPFGIVGLSTTNEGDVDGTLREGYIRRFKEKPTPEEAFSNVINAGLYILEPEVMALVPEGEKYDFSKNLFPRLLEMGWPMYAQAINGVWFDVGSPSELIRAQNVLIERKNELPFPIPEGARIEYGSFIDPTAHVHEDAIIENSVIAQHAVVGANTLLKHCVLMNGSKVENDVHLEYAILSPGATVSSNVSTSNIILGDDERLENV
ncbi:MAG: NDP-sugar synthase, partial [Candidatus Thermoplasmatota archaeon]|nr:NDP-sugar synthase [Candidatus Thermoplasmatota archaeon]